MMISIPLAKVKTTVTALQVQFLPGGNKNYTTVTGGWAGDITSHFPCFFPRGRSSAAVTGLVPPKLDLKSLRRRWYSLKFIAPCPQAEQLYRMVVWRNMLMDGRVDPRTLHAGLPPIVVCLILMHCHDMQHATKHCARRCTCRSRSDITVGFSTGG
eukprot:4646764-Amphidinium_carterae.1